MVGPLGRWATAEPEVRVDVAPMASMAPAAEPTVAMRPLAAPEVLGAPVGRRQAMEEPAAPAAQEALAVLAQPDLMEPAEPPQQREATARPEATEAPVVTVVPAVLAEPLPAPDPREPTEWAAREAAVVQAQRGAMGAPVVMGRTAQPRETQAATQRRRATEEPAATGGPAAKGAPEPGQRHRERMRTVEQGAGEAARVQPATGAAVLTATR